MFLFYFILFCVVVNCSTEEVLGIYIRCIRIVCYVVVSYDLLLYFRENVQALRIIFEKT